MMKRPFAVGDKVRHALTGTKEYWVMTLKPLPASAPDRVAIKWVGAVNDEHTWMIVSETDLVRAQP